MKFYNPDKLLIGEIGVTRRKYENGKEYLKFIKSGITIVKKNVYYTDKYFDVMTNQDYKLFGNIWCNAGDYAIIAPTSFSIYIQEVYNEVNRLNKDKNHPISKILKKVIKWNRISDKDIKTILVCLNNENNKPHYDNNKVDNNNSQNEKKLDLNYSTILTNKKFKCEPAIGRNNEVNELIVTLAQDKKNPILVGPSGTGKTTIADELAYKIQKNDVPKFLKNKQIIELDMTSLIAGTKYVGTLEEKVNKLIDYAVENEAIIFIDEIHTIYGAGTTSKSDNDVAAMIKQAIDRQGLKVIGTTTTEEYEKYFSNDALKRRFEKILVSEPTNEILYQIINKVFNDYSKNNNIKLLNNMDNIISILTELTDSKHRDKICNPDLVIGIIDRIFADAKVNNQNKLTIYNIIYGINSCNRIYDGIKEIAIYNLDTKEEKENQKIIQLKKKN